jgi:hypothetical protein
MPLDNDRDSRVLADVGALADKLDAPRMSGRTPDPPSARQMLAQAVDRHRSAIAARMSAEAALDRARAGSANPDDDAAVRHALAALADAEADARAAAGEIVSYGQRVRHELAQ